jgi:hypothetical protein
LSQADHGDSAEENIMKTTRQIAPWVAAAALVAAVGLAPAATAATPAAPVATAAQNRPVGSAGTDPLVPYGTDPAIAPRLGYINSNHDEANTTNGFVDSPF